LIILVVNIFGETASSKEHQKWTTKMQAYGFEAIYKKGKNNIVVDAVYRQHKCTPCICHICTLGEMDIIGEEGVVNHPHK
jgi:hypothetical protein